MRSSPHAGQQLAPLYVIASAKPCRSLGRVTGRWTVSQKNRPLPADQWTTTQPNGPPCSGSPSNDRRIRPFRSGPVSTGHGPNPVPRDRAPHCLPYRAWGNPSSIPLDMKGTLTQ
jgi:hypothetical protein